MLSSRSIPSPPDDSDISDLFLNSGFSAYPYREPRISAALYQTALPPLSSKPPPASSFIPRGGGKASDWCVWNPSVLPASNVASYLQLANSLSPHLGEEEVLCLLRDAKYDVVQAKHHLLEPLLHENARDEQRRRGGVREQWRVGGPWSGVSLHAVKREGEEMEGEEYMRQVVDAFEQAKRDKDTTELCRNREEVKAAFDLACRLINYHKYTPALGGAVGNGKAAGGEEENGGMADDDEATEAAAHTRSPSPVMEEIDVAVLRHVISMLVDVGDTKMRRNSIPLSDSLPATSTHASPTTTAEPSVTSALNTLQTVLSSKHDWLDKARPILSSLNKTAKDSNGVLLTTLQSLLDEADTRAPLIGSKDKKRVRQLVQRCHEWRERWQPMYDRVKGGPPVGDEEEKMTLAEVSRLVREYDRQCGGVVMEESVWYRQVMELGRRFVAVYNEKVRREERREDDDEDDEQDVVERRETRAEREKEKEREKEEGDQPKQPPAKLTIEEAEEMLAKMRSHALFLSLPETTQLSTHIAAAKEWLSSTSASITSLDPTSDEAVTHCRALLASASSFPLQLHTHHLSTLLELKLFTHRIDALYTRPTTNTTNADTAPSQPRPSLESLLHLLREADGLRLPTAGKRITTIRQQAKQAEQLASRIVSALNPKSKRLPLTQWEELLQQVQQLPLLLSEESRVERVVNNTKEWLGKASELMARIKDGERHWLEFDEVDGMVNRASGKSIALIANESVEMAVLRTVMRCGRVWMNEANTCLKAMRTLGGGHGMHSDEYRDKHVKAERCSAAEKVRWLLAVYEEEQDAETLAASSITRILTSEHSESDTGLQSSSAALSASSTSSFPDSFFVKNKLSAADFYHSLRLLSLPFASRIQDRLDEVASLVHEANALVTAITPTPLSELANTVYELRRAGVGEDDEPLLTLRERWDVASRWRREVLYVLPVGSITHAAQTEQPKARTAKRVQRARRTRPKDGKKEVPAVAALREEVEAEENDERAVEKDEGEEKMDVDEVQQAAEEYVAHDEDEDEEAEEDIQASDDVPVIPTHPAAHLSQLIALQQQYHQHTVNRELIATAATDSSSTLTAASPDRFNARLDLVSLPELSYLNSTIATCLAWQQAAQHALHSPLPTVADVKALLSQGRALGVLMAEMDELEAASWRRMWEWEVKEELKGGAKGDMEWEMGVELLRGLKKRYGSYDVLGSVRRVWDEEERKGMMLEEEDEEEKGESEDDADEGEDAEEEASSNKKGKKGGKQREAFSSTSAATSLTSAPGEPSPSTGTATASVPIETSAPTVDTIANLAESAVERHADTTSLDTTMQSEPEVTADEQPAQPPDDSSIMHDVAASEPASADIGLAALDQVEQKESGSNLMDLSAVATAATQPSVTADEVTDTVAPPAVASDLSVDVVSDSLPHLTALATVTPSPSSTADDGFLSAVSSDLHLLELRVLLYWMWSRRLHALFSRRLGAVMSRILLGTEVKPLKESIEADDDSRESAKADKKAGKRRARPSANASATATAASTTSSGSSSPASQPSATIVSSATAASDDDVDVSTLYCYCRRPYLPEDVMVECERCGVWYHIHCLNLTKDDMKRMDKEQFVCPTCCIRERREYKWREKAPTRKRRVIGVRVELLRRRQEARPEGVQGDEKRKVDDMLTKGEEWANRARWMLDEVRQTAEEREEERKSEEVERAQEEEWQEKLRELADRRKRALERKAEQQAEKVDERRNSVTAGADGAIIAEEALDDLVRVSITVGMVGAELHLRVDITPLTAEDNGAVSVHLDSNDADTDLQQQNPAVTKSKEGASDRSKKQEGSNKKSREKTSKTRDRSKDKKAKEKDSKDKKGADSEPITSTSSAPASSSPSSSTSLPPLFDRGTVSRLKEEKAEREAALHVRISYIDRLQQHLRDGLSIPLEMRERRELEDRVRLLLALEKAERIMIANTLTVRAADTPASANVSRKNEMKGLTELWEALNKMGAQHYREHDHTLNRTYTRFAAWYQQLHSWNATVSGMLQASSSSASSPHSLSSLLDHQTTQKLLFQALPLPSIVELTLRVTACIRWLPKERKVWQKQSRQSTLAKLLADRFKDCGNVQSEWTARIVRELERADDWNRRMEEAIEQKQGRSAFEALLQQSDGPDRVWLDADDIALCKQYVELYCLCRQPYQNGIFMIGCDQCDDWYHPACVGLTEQQANKIKKYICPRCCKRDGKPYPHGEVKGGVVTATVDKRRDDKKDKKTKKDDTKAKQKETNGDSELDTEKRKRKKEKRDKERAETGKAKAVKGEKLADGAGGAETDGKEKKKKRKRDKEKDGEAAAAVKVEGGADKERKEADGSEREHKKKKRRRDGDGGEVESDKKKKKHRSVEEEETRKKRRRSSSLPSTAPSSPALMGVSSSGPTAAPTAEVYANLLYEHLHRMVSAEQSNILWHLFHSYMTRPLDARLMEEINEAVKLVCGNECKEDTLKAVADRVLQEYVDKTGHVSLLPRKERKRKRAEEKYRAERERAERDDKKDRKERSKKPKGYPRAPKSAYKFFVSFVTNHRKVELERLVAEQGGDVRQQGRIIAEQWKKLSVEEKEVFEVEARKERERFNTELKRWEQREAERHMREELEAVYRPASADRSGGTASSESAVSGKSSSQSSQSSSPKPNRRTYPLPPQLTVHADGDGQPHYYFAQSAGSPSTAVPPAFVYPLYSPAQFGMRHPGQPGAVHMLPIQMIQGQNGQIMYVIPSPHQHIALQQQMEGRQATPAAATPRKADSKQAEGASESNSEQKGAGEQKEAGDDSSSVGAHTAAAAASTSLPGPGQLRLHPQFHFPQPSTLSDGSSSTSPTPASSSTNHSSPSKSAVSSPSKAPAAPPTLMQQPMILLPMSLQSPHAFQLLLQQQHLQQQHQQQQHHLQQLMAVQHKQQQAEAEQQAKAAAEPMHIEVVEENEEKGGEQDAQPASSSRSEQEEGEDTEAPNSMESSAPAAAI